MANPSIPSKFLAACGARVDIKVKPFVMIILGGAGDLSRRKLLPALFHLYCDRKYFPDFFIIGAGMPEYSDRQYGELVRRAIETHSPEQFHERSFSEFASNLGFISGNLEGPGIYKDICRRLSGSKFGETDFNLVFYLAIPPDVLPPVIRQMEKANLCRGSYTSKIIVEKPFGTDRESAAELNRLILGAFEEKQIYRMDHYLGKETVQNILFFRFSNSIFEPLWNRRYIDHIQITVAESIGVEHRGAFYEQAGVVRDIVQNHIMQLISLIAMESPVGFEADLIRDEKAKIFKTIRRMDDNYIDKFTVSGQYGPGVIEGRNVPGYRQEPAVSARSNVATFFAGKFYVDNWRLADVPFYVRTGKRLAGRLTEIYVQFNQPPLRLFGSACDIIQPNALILSIQPQEEICLRLSVKYPGIQNMPYSEHLEFNYEKKFLIKQHPPYEVLLIDCLRGDQTLFARQDEIEAMWSIVDPIIGRWQANPAKNFPNYSSGSWGPKESYALIEKDGRTWHVPESEENSG